MRGPDALGFGRQRVSSTFFLQVSGQTRFPQSGRESMDPSREQPSEGTLRRPKCNALSEGNRSVEFFSIDSRNFQTKVAASSLSCVRCSVRHFTQGPARPAKTASARGLSHFIFRARQGATALMRMCARTAKPPRHPRMLGAAGSLLDVCGERRCRRSSTPPSNAESGLSPSAHRRNHAAAQAHIAVIQHG